MEQTKIEKMQDNLDELMEDNFIDEDLQKKIRSLVVDYVIEARLEELRLRLLSSN